MRKRAVLTLGAILGAFLCVWGEATMNAAASRAWVSNYVERAIASSAAQIQATTTVANTNGMTVVVAGDGEETVRLMVEDPVDAALLAANCTVAAVAHSITNGTLFVWDGGKLWRNPAGTIESTRTNLVFEGVSSVYTNDVERFAGWFDAYGVRIQPQTSFAITNGMTEVHQ